MLNIGNLIDSSWGVSRLPLDSNPMVYQGPDANGNAQFTVASEISSGAKSFIDNVSINNTWSAQAGIRYLFN